jgi:hypothetical protein
MTTLHLGVIEQGYRTPSLGYSGKTGRPGKKRKAQIAARTTGEVAEILERRYHVMEVFYEAHADEIMEKIAEGYAAATETMMMNPGAPTPVDISMVATSKLKTEFVDFLDSGEMERMGIPGVPTQAALHGVSHRFAHPYARRGRRPSFIDTGLYEASFVAWID